MPNSVESLGYIKILSLEDIIILQMFTINGSHMIWFFRYGVQQTKFFVILDHFLPFYPPPPPNKPENQNFEKLKKASGAIIILHKCTKNRNHMLYCSLDMARNRFNYFTIWTIFTLLPP